jgi:PKD repeat protein
MKNTLLFFLFLFSLKGQSQKNNFCGQYEMEQKYLMQFPEVKKQRDLLEKYTDDFTSSYFSRLKQNKIQSDTILFVIPVVFHIMHDYGTENISKAQVQDVVRIMNEYFQKRNADTAQIIPLFQPIIGDAQVEFRLAQLDPNGNCTDGITHHQTYLTSGGNDILKTIVQWPTNKYLNIWVEKESLDNFSAYAYLPGAPPSIDGIVIVHNYVGSIGSALGNQAYSVLAHEAGHYFNLWHTWGTTNNPAIATNCNMDDLVFDTPNCIGGVCNLNAAGCVNGETANVQNMMDYCSEQMFTQGQVARMQAALNSNISNRNNLWTSVNLLLTGTNDGYVAAVCAPIADFTNKIVRICEGQSITFNNVSFGGDYTSCNWQFSGGNIAASTDSNPTVQYYTAGFYDVTLTVSNSSGSSTLTRNAIVEVSPAIAATAVPTVQDFETLTFPSNYWNFENTIGTHWETTALASVSGTKSIYLQNDSANINTADVFYTGSYNLSNVTAPIFNFKIAFANRNASNDNLKIFMSSDCGQTWVLKYAKSGNSLKTITSTALNFIPTASEWRQDAMNISSAAGQPNVRFKFQFTSQGGNNVFIDDININGVTGFETLNVNLLNLTVSPNPAKGESHMNFELFAPAMVSYSLTDITGRILTQSIKEKRESGIQSFTIQRLNATGIYFLTLKINDQAFVKKLAFE